MNLTDLCWLSTGAYAIHVIEEFALDWKGWATAVLRLPVDWNTFYLTNAVVMVLGIVAAEVATRLPAVALGFAALMLINATFFHVGPFLLTRGRFSPGLITAVLLFYPLGIASFRLQYANDRSEGQTTLEAFVIGALLMASPIAFLKIKDKPFFRQQPNQGR